MPSQNSPLVAGQDDFVAARCRFRCTLISRKSDSGRNAEEESQAKLLQWRKNKGVVLPADCAIPYDLPGIVDAIGLQ